MVGIAHTTAPHEIIYDTPEQSFGTAVSVASTMTVSPPSIQTNVPDSTTQTTTSTTTQTGTTDTPNQQTSGQSYPPLSDNLLVIAGLRDQVVDRQVAVDMEEDTNV